MPKPAITQKDRDEAARIGAEENKKRQKGADRDRVSKDANMMGGTFWPRTNPRTPDATKNRLKQARAK